MQLSSFQALTNRKEAIQNGHPLSIKQPYLLLFTGLIQQHQVSRIQCQIWCTNKVETSVNKNIPG